MKPDQIDVLAFSVLRDFEQVEHTKKARRPCQLWSDIRETDRLDRINLDRAFFHAVPRAHLDVGPHPYSDAASDFSATNSLAQALGEDHGLSLHPPEGCVPLAGGAPSSVVLLRI